MIDILDNLLVEVKNLEAIDVDVKNELLPLDARNVDVKSILVPAEVNK